MSSAAHALNRYIACAHADREAMVKAGSARAPISHLLAGEHHQIEILRCRMPIDELQSAAGFGLINLSRT